MKQQYQTATVSEKGQVTIPKILREALGITAGTELEFGEDHGRLVARRIIHVDPLDALIGIGDPALGNDSAAALAELRGPVE